MISTFQASCLPWIVLRLRHSVPRAELSLLNTVTNPFWISDAEPWSRQLTKANRQADADFTHPQQRPLYKYECTDGTSWNPRLLSCESRDILACTENGTGNVTRQWSHTKTSPHLLSVVSNWAVVREI